MILRVVKSGMMTTLKSDKAENGILNKRTLVLQEMGGKYESSYVVTALGNLATIEFAEGQLVVASLRFTTREHNGQGCMDGSAHENRKLKD